MKFGDHILTTVIAFSCSGLSDTSKIIITWMIVPTILEGRFSELKHKVWFSSQFCTNYPERAAVLDERLQVIKKGAVFLFVEWCVYWSLIIHYIILFVAFLSFNSHMMDENLLKYEINLYIASSKSKYFVQFIMLS